MVSHSIASSFLSSLPYIYLLPPPAIHQLGVTIHLFYRCSFLSVLARLFMKLSQVPNALCRLNKHLNETHFIHCRIVAAIIRLKSVSFFPQYCSQSYSLFYYFSPPLLGIVLKFDDLKVKYNYEAYVIQRQRSP